MEKNIELGYFERNQKWLSPLVLLLLLAFSGVALQTLLDEQQVLPDISYVFSYVFYIVAVVLCAIAVGFGASLTETFSARLVRQFIVFALWLIAAFAFFSFIADLKTA